ncbi:Hypothetical protein CINCED_3A007138 [Cinara cedri]|uniref:Tc1-like transposase DDE domain-containing protein n=1 Tax=Cinara cedri TaxID=506608 RepID=A0A5E4NC95_9HEMI|nr:Hypothetical protein CINCED_3A007138 [Cinara cedri]
MSGFHLSDESAENVLDIISPARKSPKGKRISSRQKTIIMNIYKDIIEKTPVIKNDNLCVNLRRTTELISKNLRIRVNRVRITVSEYKSNTLLTSSIRKKNRQGICDKVDEFDKNAIRRKSLRKILKSLNFKFYKRNRNSILTERIDLITWRQIYLITIKQFREEGRIVYYLDETWLNTGDCVGKAFLEGLSTGPSNPTNKGKRLIILHIGSDNGFVRGGLLCFKSKKNTSDYHNKMNDTIFQDWFEEVKPLLENNAVIVMDNAPYHSVKSKKITTLTWKKQLIKMAKFDLMHIVKCLRPRFNSYVSDEIAKKVNKIILMLPPYQCVLNPIELDLDRVKSEDWKLCIDHVKKEEENFWNLEFIFDELVDNLAHNTDHILTTEKFESSEFSDDDDDNF